MYKVSVAYHDFVFDTLSDAMTFVGMVLNSAVDDRSVAVSKYDEEEMKDEQ